MAEAVKIANLQIEISDNSKTVTQSLTAFVNTLKELKDATDKGAGLGKISTGLNNINKAVEKGGLGGLASLAESLANAVSPAESLANALERVAQANRSIKQSGDLRTAVRQATKLQAQATPTQTSSAIPNRGFGIATATEASEGTIRTQEAMAKASQSVMSFRGLLHEAKTDIQSLGNLGKNILNNIIPTGISRLASQFMRLAKMKILRTIITNLLKGFSEGLKNVYNWARLTGDQFATSMNTISTSMNYAKNSIGAAFATVLNSVAPIIDRLVDWLVTGINYINMFFSALSGSDTYVRAKKIATVYDDTLDNVKNGASGATGAIKELEEELSVLDFDELNQLTEPNVPSGGGGGGGGGGTGKATPDYANMFERVNIDNKIKDVADFLRNNFDTILDLVKAIGAGILAWKLANAFSNSIAELSAMQKLGFATLVVGLVLSYEGGYGIGYEGFSVKNIVETALGVGLAGIGGYMMWGATGAVIGVTASIIVSIVGMVKGSIDRNQKIYEESEIYPIIQESLKKAAEAREYFIDLKARIRSLDIESDERVQNVNIAQDILNQVKEFDGLKITPDVDLTKLDRLVELFNNLNLLDVQLEWDKTNGYIQTNVDLIQTALDEYDTYIRQIAAEEYLQEAYKAYYDALRKQNEAKQEQSNASDLVNMLLDQYDMSGDFSGVSHLKTAIDEAYPNGGFMHDLYMTAIDSLGNLIPDWSPGKEVSPVQDWFDSLFGTDYGAKQRAINDALESYKAWTQAVADGDETLGEAEQKIVELYEQLGITGIVVDETGVHVEGLDQEVQEATKNTDEYAKALASIKVPSITGGLALGASAVIATATSGKRTPQVMPPTMNTNSQTTNTATYSTVGANMAIGSALAYTSALKGVQTQEQANLPYQNALEQTYFSLSNQMDKSANYGMAYKDVLVGMNEQQSANANYVGSATNKLGSYITSIINAGNASQTSAGQTGMINTELNKVGVGVNYAGIANAISTSLGGQNFKSMGDTRIKNPIEGQVNLIGAGVSASTIYNKVGNLIGAQPFGKIGTGAKGSIEGQMNQTGNGVNANAIYGTVSKKSESQPWANIGRMMAQQMAYGLEGATASMRYVMDAVYNGMVNSLYRTPWSSIGRYIGEEIKNGLRYIIGSFDFTVNVKANGRSYNVGGSARAYFAQGGYPQSGQAFIAGERGAELVGTVGGRTGVANRDQIASAIAQALKPMLGSGGGRTETIEVNTYLDSAIIAKANAKGQVALKKQFNMRSNA